MIWSQCFDKAGDKETGLDTNKIIISSIKSISRTKINIKENVKKRCCWSAKRIPTLS